jgi:hypothetical protein
VSYYIGTQLHTQESELISDFDLTEWLEEVGEVSIIQDDPGRIVIPILVLCTLSLLCSDTE